MKDQKFWLFLVLFQLTISLAGAADVEFFGVVKQQSFIQKNDKVVFMSDEDEEDPLAFELFVDKATGGTITSVTVTTPGSTNLTLQANGSEYEYSFDAEDLLELNTQHPNGNYTFNIVGNSGTINVTLTLTGDSYPNVPRISNYTAAQSANPAANFTLSWDAFTGGTVNDFIEVTIEDESNDNEVFTSGAPGEGLNGTSTSVLIPAGTLTSGKRYNVEIMFAKIVDIDSSSGVTGVAAYTKRTEFEIVTTGSMTDSQTPNLIQFRPYYQETEVPVRSVVAFEFNEPMSENVSLLWTGNGVNTANFTYTWNHDDTILYAVYNGASGLPTSTEITWILNTNGVGSPMQDKAGNSLDVFSGKFSTSGTEAGTEKDVEEVILVKAQAYYQNTGGVNRTDEYAFEVIGELNILNGVLDGSLTTPDGGVLYPENDGFGRTFDGDAIYASKTDMDRFFPNGGYTLNLTTAHDGNKTVNLTFPSDNYPNTPTLQNFSTLQIVDSTAPLTLSWEPFTGADNSGSFVIEVFLESASEDEVFDAGREDILGTASSVIVPANTLSPGRKYTGELVFSRVVALDTSTYSGATFVAVFSKVTKFELQTTGSIIQPTLSVPGGNPGMIGVDGDKYVNYVLEATDDFSLWAAVDYPQKTFTNTFIGFFDNDSTYFSHRFYRVKETTENISRLPVSIQGKVQNFQNSAAIAGATVSTSLDGRTAVTDSSGNFFLQTGTTRSDQSQSYTITVTKSGFTTFSQQMDWGDRPREQIFNLHPQ